MGSRRTLITIAAVAVGALAVALIYGYVSSVKDEAFGDAERVKVFIVKETVIKGTYGEEAEQQKLIIEDEIPKKFFPPNAIRNFDDIAGKVAIADLAVNQIVTTDMFADPSTVQSSFADRLEKINDEDQVAITIQVDQVRGVAGLLQPGDFVNVLLADGCMTTAEPSYVNGSPQPSATPADAARTGTCQVPGQDAAQEDERIAASERFPARTLFQKVQVLAIGQTPIAVPGEVSSTSSEEGAEAAPTTQNAGLVTLIVPARSAQWLASLSPEEIYLTLVSRDYQPTPMTPIDSNHDPLPGEDPEELTPYGPSGPTGE